MKYRIFTPPTTAGHPTVFVFTLSSPPEPHPFVVTPVSR